MYAHRVASLPFIQFADIELTDDDEIIAASGIKDGPGPGMEKLDLGFDLPEEFQEMAAKLQNSDAQDALDGDSDTFIKRF